MKERSMKKKAEKQKQLKVDENKRKFFGDLRAYYEAKMQR